MRSDWILEGFMSELKTLQETMLFMDGIKARDGFRGLYKEATGQFNHLLHSFNDSRRGEPGYISKKQCQLILRYLDELDQVNPKMPEMSEAEIIKLFEKQYKLKKIVRKMLKDI